MTKSVGIQNDTYDRLKDMKRPGQSFDGIIQELLNKSNLGKVEVEAQMRVDLEKVEKALEIGHKAGQADTDLEEVKEKANLTGEQA